MAIPVSEKIRLLFIKGKWTVIFIQQVLKLPKQIIIKYGWYGNTSRFLFTDLFLWPLQIFHEDIYLCRSTSADSIHSSNLFAKIVDISPYSLQTQSISFIGCNPSLAVGIRCSPLDFAPNIDVEDPFLIPSYET